MPLGLHLRGRAGAMTWQNPLLDKDKTDGRCIRCHGPGELVTRSWTPPQYRDDLDPPRTILERKCWKCWKIDRQKGETHETPIS